MGDPMAGRGGAGIARGRPLQADDIQTELTTSVKTLDLPEKKENTN